MEYNKAKEKLLEEYKDSRVVASYKIKNGFIFSIKPKSWADDQYVLDGFFKVDDANGITEYSPVMNPEEFKRALKSRVE